MTDLVRAGLRGMTILLVGMTAWLVIVIVGVLPGRDPSSIVTWAVVAAGSVALAVAALRATMPGDRRWTRDAALAVLSVAALGFGAVVLSSVAAPDDAGRHFEGYLLLIGLILAAEGALGLAWLVAERRR
jgi:hypothetical protein